MKKTLNIYEIAEELLRDENAGWSRIGAFALAEYLDNYDQCNDVESEFDRVAIRCDFAEYSNAVEAAEDHGWEGNHGRDALEWLQQRTIVILFSGEGSQIGVILQKF